MLWPKLFFGAPQGDKIGETILQIIEEHDFPTVKFELYKEFNEGVLVAFFTLKNQKIKHCRLRCAAHEFYLQEPETLITPVGVGGHPDILKKREGLKEGVLNITYAYYHWARIGYPIDYLPWGAEPTGKNTGRKKSFIDWKKALKSYLRDLRNRPFKTPLCADIYTGQY